MIFHPPGGSVAASIPCVFGVWFLILLLALALVDIMVTLLYLDARDMSAPSPPPIVSRAGANHGAPG